MNNRTLPERYVSVKDFSTLWKKFSKSSEFKTLSPKNVTLLNRVFNKIPCKALIDDNAFQQCYKDLESIFKNFKIEKCSG